MPELVLALISICIALPGAALTAWLAVGGARDPRPDPLEEAAAAQRAARTAADAARASARAANAAELAEFDAEARRVLDALDVPCVCSQVLTHEWDERTQSYRQRWTVPEHFPSCVKHWPATTGAPPPGTVAARRHEGGPLVTPAARVAAERERSRAERRRLLWMGDGDYTIARAVDAWARQVTGRAPMSRGAIDAWERQITGRPPAPQTRELPSDVTFEPYPARRTPGGVPYRAPAAITTYGVPDGCTCVPDHTRAALANTHVLHRLDCATNRGPRGADRRWMSDNG